MEKELVLKIIANGEGIQTEFKRASSAIPSDVYETIVSFSNTLGGTLFLGVEDDGSISGIDPSAKNKMLKDLLSTLHSAHIIFPPVYLQPVIIEIGKKMIIVLQVPISSQVHKLKQKHVLIRQFESDVDITTDEHRISELYRAKSNTFSESEIIPFLTLNDLDETLFDKARQLIRSYQSDHPWLMLKNEAMLREATLYRKDFYTAKEGFTLAAALIFGKDNTIQSILPAYKVEALVRKENTERWDDRITPLRTNLIDTYLKLKDFINRNLPEKFYLEGDQRVDLRDKIFREVIGNVIVHREYRSAMATQLVIDRNHVVLTNPNNPHGMGPVDLDSFNPYPKNPNIRKFFTAMGWTDEIGSGIRNTKKYLPLYVDDAKPIFIENHIFTTTIPLRHATMSTFADKWIQWLDFNQEQAEQTKQALKNIPLTGEAVEKDWTQLLLHLVPSWSEKGTKLKELDWPKKQPLTPGEIKMVPSWAQKGTMLLHKKVVYYISIIMVSAQTISLDDLMSAMGYSNKATFRENYLKPLETLGFISKTNPDNPKASNQKYYTTSKGIQFLTNTESNN